MSPRSRNYGRSGCPTRVTLTWKIHPPFNETPSTLGSALLGNLTISSTRSLLVALARSPRTSRARIARRATRHAAEGANSLDIYMHTRYHSGEQSTRGTRTKRVSSCSPSLLLQPKERKEEERRQLARKKDTSILSSSPKRNLRNGKNRRKDPLYDITPRINLLVDRSRRFYAMTLFTGT